MEEISEIKYKIKCKNCSKRASNLCMICYNSYTCSNHKEVHCDKAQNTLITEISYNQVKETKTQLVNLHQETQEKYSKLQDSYLKIHKNIQEVYKTCSSSLLESLQMIETCLFSIQDNFKVLAKDPLVVKVVFSKNFHKILTKSSDKSFKKFENIEKVLKNFERFESFEENLKFSQEKWNNLQKYVKNRNFDSFNDFLVQIEDGLNRVNIKKIEIHPSFMENFKFLSKIPQVCPNIFWLKAKLFSKDFDLFSGIIENFKNLTQLEIEISSQAETNFYQSLTQLSQLKFLKNLSLEGLKFDNFQDKPEKFNFLALKILKLKNNGLSSKSLVSIIETFSLSSDLEYLTVENNNLTGPNMVSLVSALGTWSNLSYFSVSHNTLDESLLNLINCLKHQVSLQEFHFYSNNLSLTHLESFNQSLPSLVQVRLLLSPGLHPDILNTLKSKGFTVHFQLNNTFLGS